MKNLLAVLVVVIASTQFAAASAIEGKIIKLNLHSNNWSTYSDSDTGLLSIYIEGLPIGCNKTSGSRRVVISQKHPLFNATYSTLLAAKLSGKKVYIDYLDTCTFRSDGWDFGYLSLEE